jgi:DNA-binding response OmpR family regulator
MSGGCVLLVEAEILVRQPLAEYLRECGFKVAEAVTAAEARELLADGQLAIGIVLADASVDAEAVFALAQWLRRERPSVKIVMAGTATRTAAQAGDLCNEGPALVKPYRHKLVLDHIKRQLSERE